MSSQQDFAAALLDPDAPVPPGLTAWNGSDPAARFAIYRNNVIASLIEALADSYPVTRQLVGDTFFKAMARCFLSRSLPGSAVMAHYGADFADFVADFEPAASLPWLSDVARLEWLRVEAFHAADADPLSAQALNQRLAAPDALPQLGTRFHPSAALLRSDHAAVSIWAAHQGAGVLRDVDIGKPEQALVVRRDLDVEVLPLDRGAYLFAAQLQQGQSLGKALETTGQAVPGFDPVTTLGLLIHRGAITAFIQPEDPKA